MRQSPLRRQSSGRSTQPFRAIGPVDGLDDLAHGDLGRRAGQREAAVRAALRDDKTRVHEALEDLGEEALGDILFGAHAVQRR